MASGPRIQEHVPRRARRDPALRRTTARAPPAPGAAPTAPPPTHGSGRRPPAPPAPARPARRGGGGGRCARRSGSRRSPPPERPSPIRPLRSCPTKLPREYAVSSRPARRWAWRTCGCEPSTDGGPGPQQRRAEPPPVPARARIALTPRGGRLGHADHTGFSALAVTRATWPPAPPALFRVRSRIRRREAQGGPGGPLHRPGAPAPPGHAGPPAFPRPRHVYRGIQPGMTPDRCQTRKGALGTSRPPDSPSGEPRRWMRRLSRRTRLVRARLSDQVVRRWARPTPVGAAGSPRI